MLPHELRPDVDDPEAIRQVFQRVCRSGGNVYLKKGRFRSGFALFAESEGRVSLVIAAFDRDLWGLKTGQPVVAVVTDRGRRFQGTLRLLEVGVLDGMECVHFEQPRLLQCLDEFRFKDYTPDRPVQCTFTSPAMDICEARVRTMGPEGIQLWMRSATGGSGDLFRIGAETVLDITLLRGPHLVLPGTVVYVEEGRVGVKLREDIEIRIMQEYYSWLADALLLQAQEERRDFLVEGARSPREGSDQGRSSLGEPRMLLDRDPMILVICEGPELPERLATLLGRKYGFASLDYLQGKVQGKLASLGMPEGGWEPFRLLLVHQRLRFGSGLDLIRSLRSEENCHLPILMVGPSDDQELRRLRAREAKANGFLAVDPLRPVECIAALEKALSLYK